MSHHSNNFTFTLHQDFASSADSLTSMLDQDSTTYACRDYLVGSFRDEDSSIIETISNRGDNEHCSNQITPADRMKIVDWCYLTVDRCELDRENVAISMNIVDRFMSTDRSSHDSSRQEGDALQYDRTQYQLVAVTALYISIKMNEPVIFSSSDFAAASHGMYTAEDIEGTEIEILQGLSWRVCPPTSLQVGYQILSLLPIPQLENAAVLGQGTWDFLRDEMAFQTESAVRDYYFTTQRPSTIAIAAILNAIEQVANPRDYECLTTALRCVLKEFAFDSTHLLIQSRDRLHRLVDNEHEENITVADTISEVTRIPSPRPRSPNYLASSVSSDGSCCTILSLQGIRR